MVLFDACFLFQYSLQHKSTGTTAISIKIAAKNKASMKEKDLRPKEVGHNMSQRKREKRERDMFSIKCGDQFPVA